MNPFSSASAARLYAAGRPFYHPLLADHIRIHVTQRVSRALDVACGTGLSTRILLEFADEVIGCDTSQPMLDEAFRDPRISYVCAPATAMPFDDDDFDFITLSSGLHWFGAAAFLGEATRLLISGGKLVINDHGFAGVMACRPDYQHWHQELYLAHFPPPPRASSVIDSAMAKHAGLVKISHTTFDHLWPLSPDALAAYLLTQSNVLVAVDVATNTESIRAWVKDGTAPCFQLPQECFRFAGQVTIWQKALKGMDGTTSNGR